MEDLLKDFELPSDGLYITTDIHESQLPPFLERALSKDTTPSAPLHRTTKATNLYDMLPNEFTTAEAIEIGESMGISYRTVQTWIKKYCESKQLRKLYQGKYKKL